MKRIVLTLIFGLALSLGHSQILPVTDAGATSSLGMVNANLQMINQTLQQNLQEIKRETSETKRENKKQTQTFSTTGSAAQTSSKVIDLISMIRDLYCLFSEIDMYLELGASLNINFDICSRNLNYQFNLTNLKNAASQAIAAIKSKKMTMGERLNAIDNSFKNVAKSTDGLVKYKSTIEGMVKDKQFNEGFNKIKF